MLVVLNMNRMGIYDQVQANYVVHVFLEILGLVDCVYNFLTKSLSCTYPPNEGTQITSHGYGRKIKAYTKTPLHFH